MTVLAGGFEVRAVSEARSDFSRVVARFREEGLMAEPVVYGSHRKPEAVAMPYEMFTRLLPAIEEILLAELVSRRLSEPTVPWHQALERLGISEAELESVDLDDYTVTADE